MSDEKAALRRALRDDLRAFPGARRRGASARLEAHLAVLVAAHCSPPRSAVLAAFLPLPTEPDLTGLYALTVARGGRVAFPLISGPASLEFRLIPSPAFTAGARGLCPGPHGLLQPDPEICPLVAESDIGLILVPGLGFAPGGARLGRGAGYYDRWLAALPHRPATIGVCFQLQIRPDLPCHSHDWRVDHIVTENGWIPGARDVPRPPGG